MGEVYRARDTRLDRTVAIKVLSSSQSHREDFKQRFEREARAISSLNHPHICTLYDIGSQDGADYLVMEYVEGETLERRLERGSLPLQEALHCAAQMADALDKAHLRGIVHRDLKPANVMLTKSGVKLLDFGLAKLREGDSKDSSLSTLATKASVTAAGTILGTLQYMPPEQLEGKEADSRADIWALGCVFYESVTGRRAFEGASQASLISSIMSSQPVPVSQAQPVVPATIDHVIQMCLAKNPDHRWQSARDLAGELQWVISSGASTNASGLPLNAATHRERWIGAAVIILLIAAVSYLMWTSQRSVPAESSVTRFSLAAPSGTVFPSFGAAAATSSPTVSPDGRHVAFIAMGTSGRSEVWLRSLDSDEPRLMPATSGASFLFWSPDSRQIGFSANGKLQKIDTAGGLPQTICNAPQGALGAAWGNGTIIFAPASKSGLLRVPDQGGEPQPVTQLDGVVVSHRWPHFLPDGDHFLYTGQEATRGRDAIYLASLNSKDVRRLVRASNAVYSDTGYLLFVRGGTLFAQRFDAASRQLHNVGQIPFIPGPVFHNCTFSRIQ